MTYRYPHKPIRRKRPRPPPTLIPQPSPGVVDESDPWGPWALRVIALMLAAMLLVPIVLELCRD